eukprot:7877052-Alexandrium_andersonii.AAC.1
MGRADLLGSVAATPRQTRGDPQLAPRIVGLIAGRRQNPIMGSLKLRSSGPPALLHANNMDARRDKLLHKDRHSARREGSRRVGRALPNALRLKGEDVGRNSSEHQWLAATPGGTKLGAARAPRRGRSLRMHPNNNVVRASLALDGGNQPLPITNNWVRNTQGGVSTRAPVTCEIGEHIGRLIPRMPAMRLDVLPRDLSIPLHQGRGTLDCMDEQSMPCNA